MGIIILHPKTILANVKDLAAMSGQLDLQNFSQETAYRLGGQWLFYPDTVVSPEEFLKNPQEWVDRAQKIEIGTGFNDGKEPLMKSGQGYASYLLRLENVPGIDMAIWGWSVFTSARLFVFSQDGQGTGQAILEVGRFSETAAENLPQITNEDVGSFPSYGSQSHFILIQVANFHHSWGGVWIPPVLSTHKTAQKEISRTQKINYWLIGITSFVSLYSLSLFLRRREDIGSLWLSLYALERTLRNYWYANNGTDWLGHLKWSYELNYKLQWFFWLPSMVLVFAFFRSCFPAQTKRWFAPAILVFSGIPFLYALFTPVAQHYAVIKPLYSLGNPMASLFGLSILYRAIRDRAEGAKWLLLGTTTMSSFALVDILYTLDIVLFNFNFNNIAGIGMAAFLVCQSQIVAQRFALAFRKAEYLSRELKKEVDRQTRDIKSILDSIKQGIFSVHAVDDKIDPQYSFHLMDIAGTEDVASRNIESLLLDRSNLDPDQRAQVVSCLEASLGEDVLNFEMNQGNLARELSYQSFKGQEKVLEIEWIAMLDKQNLVDKVLVNLRDVTEVRQLQLKAQQQEEDLKILIELIHIPEDRFHRFLNKTKEYLHQNRDLVLQFDESRPEVIKQLFVNMHTIKGTARTYLLRAVSSATHEVEDNYQKLAKGQSSWDRDALLADLARVENLIERYRSVGHEKLGWQLSERVIKMPSSTLESVLASLNEITTEYLNPHQKSLVKSVRSLLYNSGFVRMQDVIEEASRGLDSIARDLEKYIPKFDVDLPLVVMRDQGVNLMHGVLVHLLRNSMDHGIENTAVRQKLGKDLEGTIYIRAELRGSMMALEYGDDGGGLNLESIREKARMKGLIDGKAQLTPDRVAALIFETGLSTKNTVSDISGRGVGLDAVKRYIEEAGGTIRIKLAQVEDSTHVPFHFEIEIPNTYFIPLEPDGQDLAS
jgi:hypothetical protein